MTTGQRAHVNREILSWAREQSGLTVEAAAKKLQVKPERLTSWEAGSDEPTIKQLRTLAHGYHFSFAIFFLSAPPEGYQPIRDYRRLFAAAEHELSPELTLEIRRAYDRRDIARELLGELESEPKQWGVRISITEDPAAAGSRLRQRLGVSDEDQASWREPAVGFREWRTSIEQAGVLVFQAAGIDLDEMRGFSIGDGSLPAIVVNRADAYAGRCFTLLHELTHIALHSEGLCNLHEVGLPTADAGRIEAFCNAVAGAALVPKAALLALDKVTQHEGLRWEPRELEPIARHFVVSRQVIIRRLLEADRTNQTNFDKVMEELEREFRSLPARQGGFLSPPDNFLSLAGRTYARLAMTAYRENKLSASALADILGLRVRHFESIEQAVAT